MARLLPIPLLAAIAALAFAWPAGAAQTVTVTAAPDPVAYGGTVTFSGAVAPAAPERITISRTPGGAPVASGDAGADGRFALPVAIRTPGSFVASAAGAVSAPVSVRVRPGLTARFDGLRVLGAPLRVTGRLTPGHAGTVRLSVRGTTRTLHAGVDGGFTARLPTGRAGRLCADLSVEPAAGYAATGRRLCATITTPTLRVGSSGPVVRYLEQRLHDLRYALRAVDGSYADDTRDAVMAFQKVERLARDGVAGPQVWRVLRSARTPRAAARGTHIEVDKTRQVLFEVRRGRVARIIHVSTGATGNTPLGRWRIYLKTPGFNSLGMYYSMYFLRGFAIHGYAAVPPYPASHGCVRVPLWFAPGLYARWAVGDRVLVHASAAGFAGR